MKRFFYLILVIIIISEILFLVLTFTSSPQVNFLKQGGQTASLQQIAEKESQDSTITIFAVGDIMLDRGVEYMVKKEGNGDFNFPFLKIADDLKKADILFGNLESIISDKGEKVGSIYSFRAEPGAIEGLIYAGFDVVSIANNHSLDYGSLAFKDSLLNLKNAGIEYVGAGAEVTKEIKKTKITFLAYTNKGSKNWGINWLDERIKEDIKEAKEKSDVVIVSFHWGEEYQPQPSQEQRYFAHLAIDSGADLVVGHHPHVIQPVEKYNDSWIAYSLGNFVFDQGFSEKTMKGLLLEVIIENKKIKEINHKEIKISPDFQPFLKASY